MPKFDFKISNLDVHADFFYKNVSRLGFLSVTLTHFRLKGKKSAENHILPERPLSYSY